MKLIRKYHSVDAAEEAARFLSSKGIVTHISSRGTKNLRTTFHMFVKVGLWAVLEHQYEDAVAVLHDPTYEVTSGMPHDEFVAFRSAAKSEVFKALNVALFWGVLLVPLLASLIYLLAKYRY